MPAPALGGAAIRAVLDQSGLDPDTVSEVILGNVLGAGLGQAPARQAVSLAGLPDSLPSSIVNKVCGSSLKAMTLGAQSIMVGEASAVIAGGMENMSQAPYLLKGAREGHRFGHQRLVDSMIHEGLWDPSNNVHMGNCAERCRERYGFSREEQDAYAIRSYQCAQGAQEEGRFDSEIYPVEVTDLKGKVTRVERDEGPGKVDFEKIPQLKPAFEENGTVTAANASTLNDGGAALIIASAGAAEESGIKPLARLVCWAEHSQEPLWFTTAPVQVIPKVLEKAGWTLEEVDLFEVNEAFAVVPMAVERELGVPREKMNVRGGAIALGHPLGASGARIVVTLIHALIDIGKKKGCAAICIGGGEAMAVCVEIV